MTNRNLKLLKSKQLQASPTDLKPKSDPVEGSPVRLTPAEQAEAARFRALTIKRAGLQAIVQRLVARLKKPDGGSKAA